MKSLLTVRETADRLGVSESLIYSLCQAGRLRYERHGLGRGTIRIAEEALEEYRRAASRPERPEEGPCTSC